MADYIFTQHGDNNVQIGGIGDMPYSVDTALKWALEHNYQSVAAQYARTLAQEVERLRAELAESQRHRENNQTCYVSEMCDGQRKDAEIAALRAENERLRALVDKVYDIAVEEKFEEVEAAIDDARWRERQWRGPDAATEATPSAPTSPPQPEQPRFD